MTTTLSLARRALTVDAFAPFGTVVPPLDDGIAFGPQDADLRLGAGIPRFYTMRIPGRGLTVDRITRHRRVTQVLASAGGHEWSLAVAPPGDVEDPDAEPALDDIEAFVVPGDTAVMLAVGTWHAGPLFEGGTQSFFNLELSDTNITDHQTCHLVDRYATTITLT